MSMIAPEAVKHGNNDDQGSILAYDSVNFCHGSLRFFQMFEQMRAYDGINGAIVDRNLISRSLPGG